MLDKKGLARWLAQRETVVLDGAMGTELERRGYSTRLPLWSAMANIEVPGLVHQIHSDYINAGAEIITANTFRTTTHTFAKTDQAAMADHCTRLAVELAREAIEQTNPEVLLAASIAPLEDCYSPELVPGKDVIEANYAHQIEVFRETQVDFILAETMINKPEIEALGALLDRAGIPFMMSFTADENGHLLDGTPLSVVIDFVTPFQPAALLLNCRSTETISATLPILKHHFDGPAGVYANGGGHPDPEVGWKLAPHAWEAYAAAAQEWVTSGARVIGGCCGTTPDIIRAVAKAVKTPQ